MSSPLTSEPAQPLDAVDPVPPGSWPDQPASQTEDVPTTEPKLPNNRGTGRPHRGRYRPRNPNYRLSRDELRDFAALTLTRLDEGAYTPPHTEEPYDLAAKIDYSNENTGYYAPDDIDLENWTTADLGLPVDPESEKKTTNILIREYSTLIGARRLRNLVDLLPETENKTVGVLNFASAKKPGGGFINGAQAQEESIARASTLYPSLISPVGVQFYAHYVEEPNNAYYTHAMIYSPSIVLFRNDIGHWMKPIEVDVLTSAAVNAGEVRDQVRQEEEMRLLRERIKEAEEKRRRKRERRRELEAELRKVEEEEAKQLEQALEESLKDGTESTEPANDTAKSASADKTELERPASPAALKHEKEVTVQGTASNVPSDQKLSPEIPTDTQETESTVETTTIDASVDSNSSDTWSTDTQDAESIVQTPTNEASEESNLLLETSADTRETEATPPPFPDGALDSEGTFIQLPPPEPEAQTEAQPDPSEPPPDPFYLAEVQIDVQMYERIGRLLYLFHKRGARHLVLGSFGTGVFQNRIELVAGIFYDLLAKPDARFKGAFDTVVFAILGGWTVKVFRDVFGDTAVERLEGEDEVDEEGSEVEGMRDVEDECEGELDGSGDGQVPGTEEAKETSVEVQMEGKESVEVQTEAEETEVNAGEIPSMDLTQEIGQPIGESDDVEMIDVTEKPVVDSQPHEAEPAASPNEQSPPSVHEPQVQSQA